jgi:hypothetical protein
MTSKRLSEKNTGYIQMALNCGYSLCLTRCVSGISVSKLQKGDSPKNTDTIQVNSLAAAATLKKLDNAYFNYKKNNGAISAKTSSIPKCGVIDSIDLYLQNGGERITAIRTCDNDILIYALSKKSKIEFTIHAPTFSIAYNNLEKVISENILRT